MPLAVVRVMMGASVFVRSIMEIRDHRLIGAVVCNSPNYDDRPDQEISLIVVHGISLPAGHLGTRYVEALFQNTLDTRSHPDFADLEGVQVSSHLLIRRDGSVLQFVPFDKRAWHAGQSVFGGRERCNDFSVGIELEGTDDTPYDAAQYDTLIAVCRTLKNHYGMDDEAICRHSDISPGRKTDPGDAFEWDWFRNRLMNRYT